MAIVTIRSTHTPTGEQDEVTTTVIAAPQPGDWPAVLAQAGDTPLFTADGSTLDWGPPWQPGAGWGTDPARISVVADAASKHGSAIEKRGFVGDKSGWRGALIQTSSLVGFRELYGRMVFTVSPTWEPHPGTGDKIFWWGQKIGTRSPTQYYSLLMPNRTVRLTAQNIQNGASIPVNFNMIPNGLSPIQLGSYATLEIRHRLNTAGNADGFLRMALNGVVVTSWSTPSFDLNAVEWVDPNDADPFGNFWNPITFGGGQFFRFWGGGAATATRTDFWRLSELHVAGRN